mmetsp:Transcript_12972/g.30852  ORF Transcript_12972/g.30852 Transcript_12972/m.30852 type:complete len:226 (+) Transcript_12972:1219-1896(+)
MRRVDSLHDEAGRLQEVFDCLLRRLVAIAEAARENDSSSCRRLQTLSQHGPPCSVLLLGQPTEEVNKAVGLLLGHGSQLVRAHCPQPLYPAYVVSQLPNHAPREAGVICVTSILEMQLQQVVVCLQVAVTAIIGHAQLTREALQKCCCRAWISSNCLVDLATALAAANKGGGKELDLLHVLRLGFQEAEGLRILLHGTRWGHFRARIQMPLLLIAAQRTHPQCRS